MKQPVTYTLSQVEEIARQSAKTAITNFLQSSNLDNEMEQPALVNGDESMSCNYKERYYYSVGSNNIESKVFYGKNKKDTDQKFRAFIQDLMKAEPTAPTLKDFVENTYRKSFMRKLAPTTVANYNNYLNRYILPVLGEKHMDQISVQDIQDFYDWLKNGKVNGLNKNIVKDTINRISGLLNRLYHIAMDLKLVTDSPIKTTLLSNEGEESGHHEALDEDEVVRIRKAIPNIQNEQCRLYMGLLTYTGMRREEIAGLGWEHLDLENGYGKVVRTVTYPDNKKAVVRNQTKTKASTREFIIPDALLAILKSCQKDTGYIIHGRTTDVPASPSTLKRLYQRAFKEVGLTGYNNHDWRATFGTRLKESGLTSAQVADLMGHADTRMVEKVYAPTRHASIMKQKDLINMLS